MSAHVYVHVCINVFTFDSGLLLGHIYAAEQPPRMTVDSVKLISLHTWSTDKLKQFPDKALSSSVRH